MQGLGLRMVTAHSSAWYCTPEEIGGADQVGEDERLQGGRQDGDGDGHGAELDGTCADDGCCEEGEEHGDSFRGCAAGNGDRKGESPAHPKTGRAFKGQERVTTLSDY